MVKALFDTNILIDHLCGVPSAGVELARYEERAISAITWMEVLVGATPDTATGTRAFLSGFQLIEIDRAVAERAVVLRRGHRIRLSDAIIWASAQVHAMLFVTRDRRDFPPGDPGVRMPYSV